VSGRFSDQVEEVRRGWRTVLQDLPAWAQVAAAALLVGVAASVANLNVQYGEGGLTVRTGWWSPAAIPETAPPAEAAVQPWRAELAALQEQLRREIRSASSVAAPAAAPAIDADAMMRRVRTLVEESEVRQQRELALRIAEVDSNVRAQRVADLRSIGRNLNEIQTNTGAEMIRLYRMTNDLAVRVSQAR
jgi:hypothetical protein